MSVARTEIADPSNNLLDAKDIIVIGDGPMALMTAILLKQNHVSSVTVVGPHLGEFTRSGDFHKDVFSQIAFLLNDEEIKPSQGFHIKDAESILYKKAKDLGVNFINKMFTGFAEKRHIILSDEQENSVEKVHADFVWDCTGKQTAVLKQFNQLIDAQKIKADKFESIHFATHADASFAMIRAVLPESEKSVFNNISVMESMHSNNNKVPFVLAMEKLRELGWKDFFLPFCYGNDFPKKNSSLKKYNLYFEVPKTIKEEKEILAYAKAVHTLFNFGKETSLEIQVHPHSKKHPSKPMVSTFDVKCHYMNKSCFVGNQDIPTIFHAGDASANIPFFTGKNLSFAFKRLIDGLEAFTFNDGKIKEIDFEQFEDSYRENIQGMHFFMLIDAKTKEDVIRFESKSMVQFYKTAIQQCKNAEDKIKMEKRLENRSFPFQYRRQMLFAKTSHEREKKDEKIQPSSLLGNGISS